MSIMKIVYFLVSLLFFSSFSLHAEGEVLKVAVNGYSPPFVMQSANKQLSGFDIELMQNICKSLKRTCQFEMMHFQDLIKAVQTKKADVAVSSIFITPERAALVNFSLPYLPSNALFLGLKDKIKGSFNLGMLNNSTIGVEKGTIFDKMADTLGIQNPKVVRYDKYAEEIEALRDNDIDFALMDEPAARYWQIQSSGIFMALGQPMVYGSGADLGVAIAVNKEEGDLLNEINTALQEYKNSKDYKDNYDRYIAYF